jgi:nicotinate-nucleotide--dimethylbenzimidazole phosphoribosyltransferase
MRDWSIELQKISGLNPVWRQKSRQQLKEQTRPEGSLGVLENLIERFAAIQKKERLEISRKRILIFAADHGITEEGVSAYPRQVTRAMVVNFLNGGATINALARQAGAEVKVIDVGVDGDFERDPRLVHAKIARGTRNFAREAAMTAEQLDRALTIGAEMVHLAKREGVELLGLGEMGIGNTSSASAVNAALTGRPVEIMTGRGTGLDDHGLEHKIETLKKACELHKQGFGDPFEVLRRVGGFEIAALTGAMIAGARLEMPMIVDGWIVTAAALAAVRLNPKILDYLFFAHQSEEAGHRHVLEFLEVQPMLHLSMRLGEASGAALAMGVLEAAVRVYNETATFAQAGVARRDS